MTERMKVLESELKVLDERRNALLAELLPLRESALADASTFKNGDIVILRKPSSRLFNKKPDVVRKYRIERPYNRCGSVSYKAVRVRNDGSLGGTEDIHWFDVHHLKAVVE